MSRLSRLNRTLQKLRLGRADLERFENVDWSRVRRLHFVCKGNICRSAFADAIVRMRGLDAVSSGIHAGAAEPADAMAVRMAAARGVNLQQHRTQLFAITEILPGDLLVSMEPWHAAAIRERADASDAQITLLGLWAPAPDTFVDDPYGGGEAEFRACFRLIETAVERLCQAWCERAEDFLKKNADVPNISLGRRPLKTLLAAALFKTGLFRSLLRKRAIVVAFHSIVPDSSGDGLRTPYVAFVAFCAFFCRYFTVVSLPELLRRLGANEPIDGLLAVTFDDGYADNAQLAAPVLQQFGIPATFFVSTGFLDSNTQAAWDVKRDVSSKWMTWADVSSLHAHGHTIGGHTVNHVRLEEVDASTLRCELTDSATSIELHTGTRPTIFAVPFGRPESLTPGVCEQIHQAGYTATFTDVGGAIDPDHPLERLNRLPIAYGDVISSYELGFDMLRECITVQHRRAKAPVS